MTDHDITYTILFTTMVILLLIAGVIITIFIAHRRTINQQVKMAAMQLNFEKELRTIQQEVQEQTMTHISRELHDHIGQVLTVVNLQLEKEKFRNPESAPALVVAGNTLREVIQQVRLLSHTLNTDFIQEKGISYTIGQEVKRLQQLGVVKIHWEPGSGELRLNNDQAIVAFRIFQEIINNALKHAEASNIYISLAGSDKLKLVIKDDGKGFDLDAGMKASKGLGLRNIVKRAMLANLSCNIDAAPGKGCTYTLTSIETANKEL